MNQPNEVARAGDLLHCLDVAIGWRAKDLAIRIGCCLILKAAATLDQCYDDDYAVYPDVHGMSVNGSSKPAANVFVAQLETKHSNILDISGPKSNK